MRMFAIAGLAVMLACSAVYAEDKPATLGELSAELGNLVEEFGANRPIEELFIVIAPQAGEPSGALQSSTNAVGGRTIVILANTGVCGPSAPIKKYLTNMGFYILEFCAHSTVGLVNADMHRLAGGSGGVGVLLGSLVFDCSIMTDYIKMTPSARTDFCPP